MANTIGKRYACTIWGAGVIITRGGSGTIDISLSLDRKNLDKKDHEK